MDRPRRRFLEGCAWTTLALAATLSPRLALAGPDFAGTDHRGRPVTLAEPGGWRLILFGYTHCPDVCPVGLQAMTETLDALGPLGERLTPMFITVDPARDTPEQLSQYVSFFHPRLVGVTPTAEGLVSIAGAWRVKYARVEAPDKSTYYMDHTATMFLVDPAGAIVRRLSYGLPPREVAERIRAVFLAR